ncbi:MAG: hypothetical protein SO238_02225 [Treponema sp.]|nr:hypothetical protein [Treponema sp.]
MSIEKLKLHVYNFCFVRAEINSAPTYFSSDPVSRKNKSENKLISSAVTKYDGYALFSKNKSTSETC